MKASCGVYLSMSGCAGALRSVAFLGATPAQRSAAATAAKVVAAETANATAAGRPPVKKPAATKLNIPKGYENCLKTILCQNHNYLYNTNGSTGKGNTNDWTVLEEECLVGITISGCGAIASAAENEPGDKGTPKGAAGGGASGNDDVPSIMTRLLQLAEALKNGDTTAEEAAAELERTYSPEELQAAQDIRDQYNAGVASMRATEASMRAAGASDEEIARAISPMRNGEKVAARRLMSPEEVQVVEERNIIRYGNPIGPTPDYLYGRYNSWQGVIDAAYRTNPDLNAILAQLGR